jgi:hypothetical protein
MNTQLAIYNKTQLSKHKAPTWNCTLGILMRIHKNAIQLKAVKPVKVFTVRNLSDIKRRYILRGYFGKKFYGCPTKVLVRILPL